MVHLQKSFEYNLVTKVDGKGAMSRLRKVDLHIDGKYAYDCVPESNHTV